MSYRVARYGWLPDLPDQRDRLYVAAPMEKPGVLPVWVDLRPQCPPVYDQGQLGSCTANAIAAAIEFDRRKQRLPDFVPSRLFIYYNERAMEHTVDSDSGAQIRDGIKSVNRLGDCPETKWPYVIARFRTRPPAKCYAEALKYRAVLYQRVVQTTAQIKSCLASGYPVVFGFTVYESFESAPVARTGQVPLPRPGETAVGGHAVVAVGYDDTRGRFIVRNSWGTRWGQKGYFTLPYAYAADGDLASDFWTIRLVQ